MHRDFPVMPRIADHATAFVRQPDPVPAVARRASTVVLVRDAHGGPEVFVMRRTASMAFAAQMHVFPGGGVDPGDADVDTPWAGPSPAQWAQRLGVDEQAAMALVAAAARELFEESGVLLAGPDEHTILADVSGPGWEQDRVAVLQRQVNLSDLLRERGLRLRTDLLTAWSRWCTPLFQPRRYDTWFFVAALPAGQDARSVGGEADHALWLPASVAAAQGADGGLAMMPPTMITLEEIATVGDVSAVLAGQRTLRQLTPWLVQTPRGAHMRIDLDGIGGGEPGPASGWEQTS